MNIAMNLALVRWVKRAYRREPIASFLLTFAAMNAAIGSAENQLDLALFGLGGITLAIAWYWWQQQPLRPDRALGQPHSRRSASPHLLPARSSSAAALPMLTIPRKRPDPEGDR
jgi:hypothetical protein